MPISGKENGRYLAMDDFKWSKTEKKIAREAFEKAYELECSDLIEKILVNLDAIHTLLGIPVDYGKNQFRPNHVLSRGNELCHFVVNDKDRNLFLDTAG